MKLGFIWGLIRAMAILVALGGLTWSGCSTPSFSSSESVGLRSVPCPQQQSISDKFYGDPIAHSGVQSNN